MPVYGTAAHCAYSATKLGGVVGLMRSFALSLANRQRPRYTVQPNGVEMPIVMNEVVGRFMAENPGGVRIGGQPASSLNASACARRRRALLLVSDHAEHVTGVTLPVDAGFNAR